MTLRTEEALPLREGARYSVRRLTDDAQMSDVILKSINGKVILVDVLWAGWEPRYDANSEIVLTYKGE